MSSASAIPPRVFRPLNRVGWAGRRAWISLLDRLDDARKLTSGICWPSWRGCKGGGRFGVDIAPDDEEMVEQMRDLLGQEIDASDVVTAEREMEG